MARRCCVTNKGVLAGNHVSHAHNKNRRRFLPNLQHVSFVSEALGHCIRLRVSTRGVRTIEKLGGLDAFLLATPDWRLNSDLLSTKKVVLSKTETVQSSGV
ncbi:MAG: 50S ribosomal protein L28 [Holosporales bacterium]|jgi:large subunit ribosomal protein L28|nr:50S ribosomal protein L28 [Holosporales bacterium]